jgi:Glycosyl transferase family 2
MAIQVRAGLAPPPARRPTGGHAAELRLDARHDNAAYRVLMSSEVVSGTPAISGARPPLVTIGIPTYNRPVELMRAARSALAQDYQALEVLISDNASTDPKVGRVGERLAASDRRVRFVRQDCNGGHEVNFQWLLDAARGRYFMWLADDDWIDSSYVTRCVAELTADTSTTLVCGAGRYYRDGAVVLDERPINLISADPGTRVLRFFARVSLNGPMFGVAAREHLLATGFPPVLAGDWMLVAALAARGPVRTLSDVHIHRSLSGLSSESPRLAESFGLRGLAARQPHAVAAATIAREITRGTGAYGAIAPLKRIGLAGAVAVLILGRFTAIQAVRRLVGAERSASLERRISRLLRALDAR